MVREATPGRRRRLPVRLLALCLCGSVLALGALPAVALAEEEGEPAVAACPASDLEIPEEMAQPEREIRGLRNDLREVCAAVVGAESLVAGHAEGTETAVGSSVAQLHVIEEDLSPALGLPVKVVGQEGGPLVTELGTGSEGSSEDNFEALEAVVLSGTETTNSDLWGIAGLFVGFMTLAALYKVVRP